MEPGDLLFHAEETAAMTVRRILGALTIAAGLAACDSGDINLSPTTVDNSNVSAPPPTQDNPCASYTEAGQTFQGTLDSDDNCFYDALFVSDTRPITVSAITFPNFGGLHIFEDSLYIGEDVDRNAAATGKRIPQEGEGTRLTIAAGNTLVFQAADSYVRIARGSRRMRTSFLTSPRKATAACGVVYRSTAMARPTNATTEHPPAPSSRPWAAPANSMPLTTMFTTATSRPRGVQRPMAATTTRRIPAP
jgi:hypothetical protein